MNHHPKPFVIPTKPFVIPAKPFVIPVFIPHAGCPHRCIFCDQERTTGTSASIPTLETMEAGIVEFLGYRKNPGRWTEISFFGGNFLGLGTNEIRNLLGLAAVFVKKGLVNGIRFSTRPDTITPDRLTWITDSPVSTIEIGVQSMIDDVLYLNGRGHTAQDTVRAVALIRQKGNWRLGVQYMVGMAGDTPQTLKLGAKRLAALAPDFARIYPVLVLEGSVLERWYSQRKYHPLSLDEAVAQTKGVYQVFADRGIPVIRMGLQPTAELNPRAGVVAGPFHPAFGELVRAALWRDALGDHLNDRKDNQDLITIRVHPHSQSQVKGQHNSNVAYLRNAFRPAQINVIADKAVPKGMAIINDRPCVLFKNNGF